MYRRAIQWIAEEDDCYWVLDHKNGHELIPSVTAVMVADLFNKDIKTVTKAITNYMVKHELFDRM